MTILRGDEFESFLKTKISRMNGLLLHGSDSSAVGELARQAMRAPGFSGSTVSHIELSTLKENPGAVIDQFKSTSLFGERSIIVINGVDDASLKYLTSVLDFDEIANFVLLTADSLSKSSKLRAACEQAQFFASLVIYEEEAAALSARLRRKLADEKLSWGEGAEALFFEVVGTERAGVNQELEKLILYCLGQSSISENDVEAVCGDIATFGTDELIDTVLAGDMSGADRMSASLETDSAGTRGILIVLVSHLTRLQALKMEIENGGSLDAVVRGSRPTIFFKRQDNFKSQLRKFSLQDLVEMQQASSAAILQTRKLPDLFEAITSRTLLSMARGAATKSN